MFRRGANANLGRIYEARKNPSSAIAYYIQRDPTPQYVGNLLRARELIWNDPIGAVPSTLPPAPRPSSQCHFGSSKACFEKSTVLTDSPAVRTRQDRPQERQVPRADAFATALETSRHG